MENDRSDVQPAGARTALEANRPQLHAGASLTEAGVLPVGTIRVALGAWYYGSRLLAKLRWRLTKLARSAISDRMGGRVESSLAAFEWRNQQQTLIGGRVFKEGMRRRRPECAQLRAQPRVAIAALTAGFAHEIGNPLGVIRGRAELLLSVLRQPEAIENLEVILAQIDDITRMVTLLVDFGRRRVAIRVTADLREIVKRAIQSLGPEASHRGVALMTDLGAKPLLVDCDPDQLQQAFVNLEANALDAMAPGGGILRINSIADGSSGQIKVSFEDTGPGVPAAIRDHIFDPFFTTKGRGSGDGMGLAVSRYVITDHDGELTLEPYAPGACFMVTLPASSCSNQRLTRIGDD